MTRDAILTVGVLLAAGLAARLAADLLRLPPVLLLFGTGVLVGPSVLDVVDVPLSSTGAQMLFTLGVSVVLFYGGISLSVDILERVWISLGMLAIVGVLLTTAVVGVAAAAAFDLPLEHGLLVGAVLSPTDPAILIPLFIGSRLRPKLSETVVAESAFNDPTAAVLALAIAGAILSGVVDLGLSALVGVVAGVLLSLTISSHRAGIWRDSGPLAVLAVVAIGYVSLDSAGGSGYLGAFLAGLVVGNMTRLRLAMHGEHEREVHSFAAIVSDLVTTFVFLIVGANVPLDALADNAVPALAVIAVLILVARPLTVLACARPDRRAAWTRPELAFLAWTRETGIVPAALVGVLAALGLPNGDVLASVVAVAIVVTLVLQAVPAPWLARRLDLLE
jgi:cell volume regulation protein A